MRKHCTHCWNHVSEHASACLESWWCRVEVCEISGSERIFLSPPVRRTFKKWGDISPPGPMVAPPMLITTPIQLYTIPSPSLTLQFSPLSLLVTSDFCLTFTSHTTLVPHISSGASFTPSKAGYRAGLPYWPTRPGPRAPG
jgi:hypothetical protein